MSDNYQFDRYLQTIDPATIRLPAGRILIAQDPLPTREGSLFLPQRDAQPDHPANTGTVLAIGHGAFTYDDHADKRLKRHLGYGPEEVQVGDRVVFRLLMSDLNQTRVMTDIRRVDAVIEK